MDKCERAEALRRFAPKAPPTFLEVVKEAIDDEWKAINDYRNMSLFADRLKRRDIASVFDRIAQDEERHHNELVKIYNGLIKEQPK